jgi:hypothetical protein
VLRPCANCLSSQKAVPRWRVRSFVARFSLFFPEFIQNLSQHFFLFHSGFGFCGIRLGHRPIDASKTHDHATLRELLYLVPRPVLAFLFSPQHLCVSMCAATNTVSSVTEITGVQSDHGARCYSTSGRTCLIPYRAAYMDTLC